MLSKEKLRLMTTLAIYQKNGGTEELSIAQHYRFDYIQSQLFSSAIRYTICFLLGLGTYLLLNTNSFFSRINAEGFVKTIRYYGIVYLAGLFIYLLIALAVYTIRYNKAVSHTAIYASGLKRLDRRFPSGKRKET